jgi:hypothetical protein
MSTVQRHNITCCVCTPCSSMFLPSACSAVLLYRNHCGEPVCITCLQLCRSLAGALCMQLVNVVACLLQGNQASAFT